MTKKHHSRGKSRAERKKTTKRLEATSSQESSELPKAIESLRKTASPKTVKRPRTTSSWWKLVARAGLLIGIVAGIVTILIAWPDLVSIFSQYARRNPGQEVRVILTDFNTIGEQGAAQHIYDSLSERISTIKNAEIDWVHKTPLTREEAFSIGDENGATLVIWGEDTKLGFEARYIIVRNREKVFYACTIAKLEYDADVETLIHHVDYTVPVQFEYLTLTTLGQIAYFADDFAQSTQYFEEAQQLLRPDFDPSLAVLYLMTGDAYYYQDNWPKAIENFSLFIQAQPNSSIGYHWRGDSYLSQASSSSAFDDFDRALKDYDEALNIEPDSACVLTNRATVYSELDKYGYGDYIQFALDDFQRAIDLGSTLAYFNRAEMYERVNEFTKALQDYRLFLEYDRDYLHLHPDALARIKALEERLR